ncbi:hypothetical protein [Streptomyces sp. WAC 04229]|uniref:hypothetical protein n=1 Tax=Streptomyces sp. WAC 04229 TaxID=2203206 RepID=UPI003D7233A6
MNLEVVAALTAAGAALITSVGLPATYMQARAAHRAAANALAAAQLAARTQHVEARRIAQRDSFVTLLVSTDKFATAAFRRSLEPLMTTPQLDEASELMADAHDELRKAVAVVTLDVPAELLGAVERLQNHAETLFISCQTDGGEDDHAETWWVAGDHGDVQVSADTVIELFESARQTLVTGIREYLNADASNAT